MAERHRKKLGTAEEGEATTNTDRGTAPSDFTDYSPQREYNLQFPLASATADIAIMEIGKEADYDRST